VTDGCDCGRSVTSVDHNEGYRAPEFVPGLILFGTDGGNEAYAFDATDPALPVVRVPFIPLDRTEAIRVSDTFVELLEAIERGDAI